MTWSRIFMSNGMRYDFPADISEKITDFSENKRIYCLKDDNGRVIILNPAHIVSVEIDGGE